MNKTKLKILGDTSIALASGLFTGGVVTLVIATEYSKEILLKLFIPALIFYYFYILMNVIREDVKLKITDLYVIISIVIGILFGIFIIYF